MIFEKNGGPLAQLVERSLDKREVHWFKSSMVQLVFLFHFFDPPPPSAAFPFPIHMLRRAVGFALPLRGCGAVGKALPRRGGDGEWSVEWWRRRDVEKQLFPFLGI